MRRTAATPRARLAAGLLAIAAAPAFACMGANPAFERDLVPDAGTSPSQRPPADGAVGPKSETAPANESLTTAPPAGATPDATPVRDAGTTPETAPAGPPDTAPADVQTRGPNAARLLGYWPLDDGPGSARAADASGNGRHGTLEGINKDIAWVAGKVGSGAMQMPSGAPEAGVRIPSDAGINAIRSFTVAAWFKRPSLPLMSHKSVLSRQVGTTSAELFNISCNGNDVIIYIPGEGSQVNKEARGTGLITTANRWYHVAGTYDGSTLKLYVDGALAVSRTSFTDRLSSSSTDVYIGTNKNATASDVFDGTIDEVVLFGVALPAEAIKALHQGTSPLAL